MASPRTISILKRLSPQNVSSLSQTRSPRTPIRNTLAVSDLFQDKSSPRFNVDTPSKDKIVRDGILEKQGTILGNGAFGVVYKASYKGKDVAAKLIKNCDNNENTRIMEKETAFLRHSNIVKILKVDQGPAATLITMELCGKSLDDMIDQQLITKEQRIHVWNSIAKALEYCHNMGIVHADVKPKNVLMGKDDQPKLADFGSAVFIEETDLPLVFHGTPGYAAPEVVRGNKPTPCSDVYSLGILAWQMISRKVPFEDLHKHTILYLTGIGTTPFDNNLEDNFDGRYKNLYRKCWNKLPQSRPSVSMIIKELNKLL